MLIFLSIILLVNSYLILDRHIEVWNEGNHYISNKILGMNSEYICTSHKIFHIEPIFERLGVKIEDLNQSLCREITLIQEEVLTELVLYKPKGI
ncbi:MAG: hypothetical protein EOM50_24740 [Erysipelotrichia bacterium]|nr:hypothetical protein [Erysipelotrichia bacterium]